MLGLRLGAAAVALALFAGSGTAEACGTGKVLFEDSFETLQSTWGKADEELMVENGSLLMKPKANFTFWAPNTASIYDDVDVCAEVTSVEVSNPGNSFVGLVFWYEDDKNFYTLEIDADGYASIWRRQNGRWLSQVDWIETDSLKAGIGSTNELRVVTKGKMASYYLNGKLFREVMGLPPDGGQQVGTIASSPKETVAIYSFADFKVPEVE
jgi:hypothetical protein